MTKDEKRIYMKAWKAANRANVKAHNATFYARHKEALKPKFAKYFQKNKTRLIAQSMQWERDHPEKRKEHTAKYRAAHPEQRKQSCGEWYRNNKEKATKSSIRWRKLNPEKAAAINSAYRERHPDRLKERSRTSHHKRRARERNAVVGDLNVIAKWEKTVRSKRQAVCFWCKDVLPSGKIHVDHILALALGGSHDISNLCASCRKCNQRKNAKPVAQWNESLVEPVLL